MRQILKSIFRLFFPAELRYKLKHKSEYNLGYRENSNKFNNKKRKVYLIGTSDTANLGDEAIAIAEIKFINDNFGDFELFEITENEFFSYYKCLKEFINEDDIIFMNGGGNIGNTYISSEIVRRLVIKKFRNNSIVIFPQTVDFGNDFLGKIELKRTVKVYRKHKKLLICTRERKSYNIAKTVFKSNQIILTPDIVTYLTPNIISKSRDGILLCFRNDVEKSLLDSEISQLYMKVKRYRDNVQYTDTELENRKTKISSMQRETYVNRKLEEFSGSELILTDRLHGMVFSAISGTPCIVFSNFNHKVQGVYAWLKNLNYISFIENLEDIDKEIERLINLKNCKYDNLELIDRLNGIRNHVNNLS